MKFLRKHIGQIAWNAAMLICAATIASYAQVWNWSQTASTNATVDPQINWAEGMPPSAVNDSARSMMARLAEYRDDVAGLPTDTGTASAYAITSSSGSTNPPKNRQEISFVPANTNVIGVTLAVDGGTAYPIQAPAATGIGAGVMVAGTPYTVVFSQANSSWLLKQYFGNPFNVPLGAVLDLTYGTAPNSNFAIAAGQCISSTTYAALNTLFGATSYTPAGGGSCPGGQFAIPDLRGRIISALDNQGGTNAFRMTICGNASILGATCGSSNTSLAQNQLPNRTLGISGSTTMNSTSVTINSWGSAPVSIGSGQGAHTHGASGGSAFVVAGVGGGIGGSTNNVNTSASTASATLPAMSGTISGSATGTIDNGSGTISSGNTASINGNVTQQTLLTIQPSMFLYKMIRIL